jgi:aspartyl-tRNA(Asn)/glutamyl-tRNA(Gln) amidotransferase subunit A
MTTNLTDLTLTEALDALKRKTISSVELTQAYLDQINRIDPQVKAFITITAEQALEQARAADTARAQGSDAPLLGLPLAIKDVISTKGVETTAASKILKGYVPPYDATVVARLKEAGIAILGKLNLDEFAMGSSTENSGFFVTRNPWNLDHVPGGSSGGSAAAPAAHMALGTLGTDTGGSIRLPGSFCGVAALKPSYGRVSRYGLIAFGSSLDQAGPMARTVEDVARIMQVIAGHDPLDSTSMQTPVPDYVAGLTRDVKGLKIGLPKEYFASGLQPEVEQAVRAAAASLESMGAELREVTLPHSAYSLATYYIIACSEASANLARMDGVRFGPRVERAELIDTYKATRSQGFGPEVKRRIMLGTYALSAGYYDAWYGKAQAVRTLIKQDFDEAFKDVDVMLSAVAPTTAFKFGANMDDPMQMYLADILTISLNLAGVTGMSVPCGFDQQGLPIGLQLMAPAFREDLVMRVGHAYEQAHEWHKRTPALIQ